MRSVHQGASFELSKTVLEQLLKNCIIKGVEGVQKLPDMEKKVKQVRRRKNLNKGAKRNKKMGGKKFVIICGGHSTPQWQLEIHCLKLVYQITNLATKVRTAYKQKI